MSALHVLVIAMALASVVVCANLPACSEHVDGVVQLATACASGAIGHAMAPSRRLHRRTDEQPTTRVIEYDLP